jgi:superfamily II DNA/RNA helicase
MGCRSAKLRIMISTDLEVCSLDGPNISHIIYFDMPINGNKGYAYVHLSGCAGWLGRRGKVMSFHVQLGICTRTIGK